MSQKSLKGKVAVITGASKGLGKAMALALAEGGARLALASRNEKQLNAVAEEAQAFGTQAKVFVADVTQEEQVAQIERDVPIKTRCGFRLRNGLGQAISRAVFLVPTNVGIGEHPDPESHGRLALEV